jgi:hypothetical protein
MLMARTSPFVSPTVTWSPTVIGRSISRMMPEMKFAGDVLQAEADADAQDTGDHRQPRSNRRSDLQANHEPIEITAVVREAQGRELEPASR